MKSARQVLSALAGVLVAGALAGCAEDNTLSGSVSELFPMEVSWVEVRRSAQALQVSYYRNTAVDVDLVVRLTVDTTELDLSPGKRINLAGEVSPGQARTTVVHLAAGEPARVFVSVNSGDLVLEQDGQPGELTRGNFSMSFRAGQGYGAGRSLAGRFAARAENGGWGPEPGDIVLPDGGTPDAGRP
jgi:hypothetical protein